MAKIKFRRDTAANWLDANPTLAQGEPGFEHDTGLLKIGNGATAWADLDYSSGSAANVTDEGNVVVQAGSTAHWIATQRRDQDDTYPRALRYDSQGNLYALTESNSGQDNVVVVTKYTAAGSIAWQKTLTNRGALNLAVDSSDQAYVVTQFGPELQIIKFSTTGTVVWDKNYNYDEGTTLDDAFIEEKNSTSLVVAVAVTVGPNYALLLDISTTDGSVNTQKTLERDSQNVYPTGIDVTDDGATVYVTGYYYDGTASAHKMFIEKMNSSLVRVWSKSLDSGTNYDMYGGDCASDAQGNIYAVGSYQVDTINTDQGQTARTAGVLTKLNSAGVVQWTRRIGPGPCGGFAAGLTATDIGDVYLSALTFTKRTDGEFIESNEFTQEIYGSGKLIVARYNTQGAVIWQRYVDVINLAENYDNESSRGQAIAVYDNKFAVDGYGNSWDTAPLWTDGTDDNEYDYFVAQLPTDGTALTIGKLEFTESRVPGRFVTHAATDIGSDMVLDADTTTLAVTDFGTDIDAEARVANNVIKSSVYQYTFGAEGTLTIPNDGDLRLTQTQVGYLTAIGGSQNYNDDINSRAVAVDTQGYMYVAGEEDDDSQPFVVKIDPTGAVVWSVRVEEDDDYDDGRANGIAIHPTTGHVMLVCEFYGSDTYSALITLDQDTGRILNNQTFSDSGSDVYLNDIAYNSTGDYVLAGSKNGEFSTEIPVTAQTGSTTGTIVILRSAVSGNPNSWQIGGTGIDPFENIAYVERYTGLTGTVRQGSGATFDIINNGNGTYSAGVVNGGTNYRAGHKIKILGTSLGGATPDNDIVITVQAVDGSGAITGVGNSGTAASLSSPSQITFTGESGVTFSGSTNTFNFSSPRSRALAASWNSFAAGATMTAIVNGDLWSFTLADPPVSGSNIDPMNPVPYTINVTGDNGLLSGTVTSFTISTTSNLTETTYSNSISVDSMNGPTETLRINKPISSSALSAAIASIPSGATIAMWNEMGSLAEFTLTSAFTEGDDRWNATFTRTSGSISNGQVFRVSTAAGSGGSATYTALPGTNTDVGSGMTFTFEGSRYSNLYGDREGYNVTTGGTNYADGDVIVVLGTSLGGTTPANDMTLTAYAPEGNVGYFYNIAGTSQSTTWKLETTTQADFGGAGAWSITYPLSRESLLITPTWTRTFGTDGNNTDRLYAVAVDSNNNIIAVGEGQGNLSPTNTDDLAVVYKFNSTGTLQWTRKLNERNDDCYAKSVVTIGTDIYVTHDSNDDGETVITKLDTTGTVKWQRITDSGDDSVIARTADGNLLVTCEAYNEDIDDDALKVFLLTPSGEVVYKRWLMATTDDNTRFKNGRCLAVDSDSYYITAYFGANNYDSSMAAKLPIDGAGTGEHGSFRYTDVNAMTGSFQEPGLTGVNYDVDPVNLGDENNYAGPLYEGEEVYIKTTSTFDTSTGSFYVNAFDVEHTVETVRDTDGGRIVFADGTTQNTSATDIPQRRYHGQRYTLGMKDRGHHILCRNENDEILVPYNSRVEFPVGTVITIVNPNSDTVNVYKEGGSTSLMIVGDGFYSQVYIEQYGMATLLKVGREEWVIAGNVQPN